MSDQLRILYCHCAYAKVVPDDVKQQVLQRLADSDVAFDAVADLCEMSAAHDPSLGHLAGEGRLCIAACYPRTVKWLFHAAGAPLPSDGVTFANMRTESVDEVLKKAGVAESAGAPA